MVWCYSRHSVLELSIRVSTALDGTRIRLQAGLPEHPQLPLAAKLRVRQMWGQADWCWVMLCCMSVLGSCWLLLTLMTWSLPLHNARSRRMWLPGQVIIFRGMQTHMHVCRCETHHKLLLMTFLQKIIKTELQEEGRMTRLGIRLLQRNRQNFNKCTRIYTGVWCWTFTRYIDRKYGKGWYPWLLFLIFVFNVSSYRFFLFKCFRTFNYIANFSYCFN